MSSDRSRLIRASEVGEYVYCHRAWWLGRVGGLRSANVPQLQAGASDHQRHGRGVSAAHSLQTLGYVLLGLALLLALWWFAGAS